VAKNVITQEMAARLGAHPVGSPEFEAAIRDTPWDPPLDVNAPPVDWNAPVTQTPAQRAASQPIRSSLFLAAHELHLRGITPTVAEL
jgi:hypothetical protein